MSNADGGKKVFLSAAEASGDAHCAGLVLELKKLDAGIEFVGVGGDKMEAAGCELLEHTAGRGAMAYNAFSQIGYFRRLIKRISAYLHDSKVDVVVVCDSPAFNWHVAKAAKKVGLATVFYVAPQLWAWAPWRIRKLHKWCDKLCCILPFEQEWFGSRGVDAEFVGNPLFDELDIEVARWGRNYSGFEPASAKVAIMPGSRNAEIRSLWQPMQEVGLFLRGTYPALSFKVVAVSESVRGELEASRIEGFDCEYGIGTVHDTAKECDFSIVTSGSATLQVAAAGCPMVIMYQSSRLLWHLVGRWLIKTKYLSLVNILAQRELVPEFMPHYGSVDAVAAKAAELLGSPESLSRTSRDLEELVRPLAQKRAGEKVAHIVYDMTGQPSG